MNLKSRFAEFYEKHETKVDLGFFVAGFVFDVFTLADVDDPLSIIQQLVYFAIIGFILYHDFLERAGVAKVPERFASPWNYRHLVLHFLLGSLLSIYSLFFLKSSSLFSSIVFVLILMGLMIANELKIVQKGRADIKIALSVICVFSFFSMMFPIVLGFVGLVPFGLALAFTGLSIFGAYRLLLRRVPSNDVLRGLVGPAGAVMALFMIFYSVGWIPPVPLSVQSMGVYHEIAKVDGTYILSHERPWWKFWRTGDQDFLAEPGDKIYFFAQIFSPGRFDDAIVLHWLYKDPRQGWQTTDRVPMRVTGGRRNGYRGFAVKQNYQPGEWRVSVETTDAREIGRFYFEVTEAAESNPQRMFQREVY